MQFKAKKFSVGALAAAALGAGVLAGPGIAAAADAALIEPAACAPHDEAREKADFEVLKAAEAAAEKGGFPALKERLPALEAALAHAPASMNPVELCEGRVDVHASSMEKYLVIAAGFTGEHKPKGVNSVEWRPSPYPLLSLRVGSTYVEYGRYDAAVTALKTGLALEPTHPQLSSEAAHALDMLERYDEALAICDRALNGELLMANEDRARLLRSRGFALGELKRYDEAEQSYHDSLKLQPGNSTALNELKYIAQQRRGAPRAPSETINSATGQPVTPH